MDVDQKILSRIIELISVGERVLATRQRPPANAIGFPSTVDSNLATQWATSAQRDMSKCCGSGSWRSYPDQRRLWV